MRRRSRRRTLVILIRTVVTDIEGTTSSLSFVKNVLFPYARRHLADFIAARRSDPEVERLLNDARREAGDVRDDQALLQHLYEWIDNDRKITPLKSLQGLIWREGYARGDFRGHVYEDAARNLRRWHGQGLRLYVYSSGSVQAQQLLFRYSEDGDLTPLFSGYFDTAIGHKRDIESYRRIAADIGEEARVIAFLSDIKEELDAAAAAGFYTVWLVRDGAAPAGGHRQARDFDAIRFDEAAR